MQTNHNSDTMTVKITPNDRGNPAGKLADAELHFGGQSPLAGLKLIGFSIWERRGDGRHYVSSKVMSWVAFDRGIKSAEKFGFDAPLDRWRALRDAICVDVCEKGFDREQNTFVQFYGSKLLDASILLLPGVGFLAGDDPRKQRAFDGCVLQPAVERMWRQARGEPDK